MADRFVVQITDVHRRVGHLRDTKKQRLVLWNRSEFELANMARIANEKEREKQLVRLSKQYGLSLTAMRALTMREVTSGYVMVKKKQ